MNDSRKRMSHGLAMAATVAAILLAGCSRKDEGAPAPAPAPSASKPAAAAGGQPLKMAFIYVGPVGDGGWSYAHDIARKAVDAEFGDKVKTSYVESVPEGPDAERVLRDLASQGNKVVFATSFGYMEQELKVAGQFKDVYFEHATGYKTAPNLRTYDARTYEGAYMAGVVAGSMTKTNTLGVVASIPIPEVIRNIDSFTLGALSVNPAIHTRVVWVNKWFDPPREAEAATSLINQGADVLMQNTDSPAVLQTAEKMGKMGFGWDSDMTKYGPGAHLGSAVIDWAPYYKKTARDVLEGSWKVEQTWWGVKEGAIDLVSLSEKVPADARRKLDEVKRGLKDGSFSIWKGPILDQAGKEVLPAGQVADDAFLKDIKWYVKGVEGKLPAGS